jgi:hypothetical protein
MRFTSARGSLSSLRKLSVISGAMFVLAATSACAMVGKRGSVGITTDVGHCKRGAATAVATKATKTTKTTTSDAYDQQVLSLNPALYLTFSGPSAPTLADLSGHGHTATYFPAGDLPGEVALPNGDMAADFDGQDQYAQVPSSNALSVTDTGCLTIEAWIMPTTLQFPNEEGTGYVYVLGKGVPGEYEYAIRIYSAKNTEVPERPNRISGYVWNLAGGLGSGAYFQDPVKVNQWIMLTLVLDDRASLEWPDGYVAIYKDGVLRDQVSMNQYNVRPQAGNAPLCIGTRNNDSYFEGGIGKVAIYDHLLSSAEIAATYAAMFAN